MDNLAIPSHHHKPVSSDPANRKNKLHCIVWGFLNGYDKSEARRCDWSVDNNHLDLENITGQNTLRTVRNSPQAHPAKNASQHGLSIRPNFLPLQDSPLKHSL